MIKGLAMLSTWIGPKVNRGTRADQCVACLAHGAREGLCDGCWSDLPINETCCHQCALPLPRARDGQRCGECLRQPPPFHRAHIPWRYQYPMDGLLGRYKYRNQLAFGRPLIAGLADFLEAMLDLPGAEPPEQIIPAPMFAARRRRRGFNQAQDIAEQIGQRLNLPVNAGALTRVRAAESQRGLDRAGRLRNLEGVYAATGPVTGHVALLDDVVTTGATARAMAATLLASGADSVELWALARTPS
ncbi:ComF family protein [Marinobacter sp. C2H3]|uniref:ComF family protein n=1 Tax=Marinobacter sp. C2H3 TaxID=3119003 RepID=UPI00300E9536